MDEGHKYNELEKLVLNRNKVKSYVTRLELELNFIKTIGSAEFFLTAFDIANELKQKSVVIGPSIGYANSSLINFVLGLTTINPIKYNLVSELYYFGKVYPEMSIGVSDKKKISKKGLARMKGAHLKIHELTILQAYQSNNANVDYKFYPNKVKKKYLNIDFQKESISHLQLWEIESSAMTINSENDLINSIAFASYGLKGFHLSKLLQNKHISFKELNETNGFLLFQEQWIKLVSKFTKIRIDESCKLKSFIGKRTYSLNSFMKHFPKTFNSEKIDYLFNLVYFLPSKSHVVAESKVLSLLLNSKKDITERVTPAYHPNSTLYIVR